MGLRGVRSASLPVQLAAFAAALLSFFAASVANLLSANWFGIALVPVPAIVVIIACLVTAYTRSPWPAIALAALEVGFASYVIALNLSAHTSLPSEWMARSEFAGSVGMTAELGVGALAGWFWYQREARLSAPSSSA